MIAGDISGWMKAVLRCLLAAALICVLIVPGLRVRADPVQPLAVARHGMVVSGEALATRIGVEILKRGGNAIDAAVAVGFALAVTLPDAGNLGGGGFMLLHLAGSGESVALDYRETAPAAASEHMFVNSSGAVDTDRARFSHLSAGVPGTVAGLSYALEHYGSLSLEEVMVPAIRLAEEGYPVSAALAELLHKDAAHLRRSPASRQIFMRGDGTPYKAGERLLQPDLAWSLGQVAAQGPKAFYGGAVGHRIVTDMARHGGLITLDDLKQYRPVLRVPVRGHYRGHEIIAMPPPSSGGVHLIQMLNILEGYPIARLGHNSASTLHLMAEAMKRAYGDRSRYLGDPDYFPVPVRGLTSRAYANVLRQGIHRERVTPVDGPGNPVPHESAETTHFTVVDSAGNIVTNTYTLNFRFGSGIVAAGTGILLNNEMDDFSARAGVPNAYGLLGGQANAIAAGRRPLSSMTPVIVMRRGQPVLATGSPGGSRIITTVLQVVMNVIDHGMSIAAATAAPRVHHQWRPDKLQVEEGLSAISVARLKKIGHRIIRTAPMGVANSVMWTDMGLQGVADLRRRDGLPKGY